MDIRAYLLKHDLTQEEFAELLDVSPGLVWQWLHGRTAITAERAKQIEERTGGKIKRRELRPDVFGKVACG